MSEANEKQEEKVDNRPLREKDPAQWKARKKVRQDRKNRVRAMAKKAGVKLGRWRGGVALAKDGRKLAGVAGNGDLSRFPGYSVFEGGAK